MNRELILKMVEPYLSNNTITESQFSKVFCMLPKKEQYEVIDILIDEGIEIEYSEEEIKELDESLFEDEFLDNEDDLEDNDVTDETPLLYDESIFNVYDENYDKEILANKWTSNGELCVLAQQGNEEAMERLCITNRKLVAKCASDAQKYLGNAKLDFDDLFQAGMIGLIKGILRFDNSLGYRFSTYVIYWIKQSIYREIDDNGYTIRIPVHMMETIRKVRRIYGRNEVQQLTPQERKEYAANELGISIAKVEECLYLLQNIIRPVELDAPIGEGEDSFILDILSYDNAIESPEEYTNRIDLSDGLNRILNYLTEREAIVLKLRFGLVDGKEYTLEEVGKKFNVTRERIRQIEAKALRKMKHPNKSRPLSRYIDEKIMMKGETNGK